MSAESENKINSVRVDKWLWSVRICKTRRIALDLCKKGKVFINDQPVKPSRDVRVGDILSVRRDGILFTFEVLKCIDKRVGAPIAETCRKDKTTKEELEKIVMIKKGWVPRREKGAGRPTKKDRRDMEAFLDPDRE